MAKILMQVEPSKLRKLLLAVQAALSYLEEREDFRLQDGRHVANEEGQLAAALSDALDKVGQGLPESWRPRTRPPERSTICQMPSATDWPKGEGK